MNLLNCGLTFILLDLATTVNNGNSNFTINGNIIYFLLTKLKRVTCSMLALEVYGIVASINIAYAILLTLAMVM
ncbi:hypothetical protein CT0861_09967 [Colletotrichum tofieldiae]|uniref:Uncharacterized protein n=1 Tax=Colletotrichum tofieldiae TaxID=708197 RepID=A0A166N777_9PEZI|nr:hypothetical protein CT0861_09967 [Colletotrichum tofieldiae]